MYLLLMLDIGDVICVSELILVRSVYTCTLHTACTCTCTCMIHVHVHVHVWYTVHVHVNVHECD